MAVIEWPADDAAFALEQYDEGIAYDVLPSVARSGRVTTRSVPGAAWRASLQVPAASVAERVARGRLLALLAELDGGGNQLSMFNPRRLLPQGTLRNAPTLNGAHAPFAETLALTNCLGYDNLLLRPQEFDNAAWVKNNVSMTANAVVAPDGTTTAETMVATTAGSFTRTVYQPYTTTENGTYIFSCYAKLGTLASDGVAFYISDQTAASHNFRANFNLTTLAVPTVSTTGGTWVGGVATVTSVGNGWVRLSISGTTNTAHTQIRCYIFLRSYAPWPETTGTVHLWGAMLAKGSTLYPYASGATLLRGDRFGIAGQRFMAIEDAIANGAGQMSVKVRPRVRVALSGGAAVVYDRPRTIYVPRDPSVLMPQRGAEYGSFAVELEESWL